jgi:hypothetical protein
MSTTSTSVSTHTRTQTATYLTDVVMGSIASILADLKIDLTILDRDWKLYEAAFSAWIEEESLEQVVLQCHQPNGTVKPIIEFPVAYTTTGTGDATFTASRAALARYQAKVDRVPVGTTYTLICTFRKTYTPQPGWGPGSRESTDGLQSLKFGTLASAPHANLAMRYLH